MIRKLTKSAKLEALGFKRDTSEDFVDDYNRFTGWKYKDNLVLTQHVCGDRTYLSIRLEFLARENGLPYKKYSKLPCYKLADKFNGINEEFDEKELAQICEQICEELMELKEELSKVKMDKEPVRKNLLKYLDEAKKDLDEVLYKPYMSYDLTGYQLREIHDFIVKIKTDINSLEKRLDILDRDNLSWDDLEMLEDTKYSGYWKKCLDEILENVEC